MTDLSVTPGNVIAGSNAVKQAGLAGATVQAGQTVYKDPSTGKWSPADADSGTSAVRNGTGIALNGASLNQPLQVLLSGDITIGATLVAGTVYVLSDTPGGIMPYGDLETGDYPVIVGIAKSTSVLSVQFNAAGVAI